MFAWNQIKATVTVCLFPLSLPRDALFLGDCSLIASNMEGVGGLTVTDRHTKLQPRMVVTSLAEFHNDFFGGLRRDFQRE